jgi:biotin carboxyl carrier protein
MELEIKINNKLTKVKLLSRDRNIIHIMVGDKTYKVDLCKVETNEYSVIHNGTSHNVEVVEGASSKKYITNTYYRSFDVEIVDAEARYQASRNKGALDMEGNIISSPMPGKVVKILVNQGDSVNAGQTAIIVSAMKMESEYKISRDAVVKKIMVKEGDTVNGHQPLIEIK